MRLEEVVAGLGTELAAQDQRVEVTSIDHDSRQVHPGSLFCCVVGTRRDGHDFASEAVARGAVALLVERALPLRVAQVTVPDVRRAIGPLAATFFAHPSVALTVVGVTGTNGKTTIVHLLRNVLIEAGLRTEVLGTLSGTRTTPEAPELQRQLASWRDDGVDAVAMEVSSHALALHRIDGTHFEVAVFTNLSRDHLDFHQTMEGYFEAKARLFGPELSDQAVVNLDSPQGRLLLDDASIPTRGYGLEQAEHLVVGLHECRFTWRGQPVALPLGGGFNVANALAAAETAIALDVAPESVAAGLSRPILIPGRFEAVDAGQPFSVIVDYAHTPDGLAQLLETARGSVGRGRVIVVFGCGGDRDPTKRPAMGEVAARLADRVVLTADNSRGEDTGAIISAVKAGFDMASSGPTPDLLVEPDRRAAINVAVTGAAVGDVVLIAGKGHETTQTEGTRVEPFDDRLVALEALAGAGWQTDGTEAARRP